MISAIEKGNKILTVFRSHFEFCIEGAHKGNKDSSQK